MSFSDKIDLIINNEKQLLIENYFELQAVAEKKYGKNTVIFIEIGSFYETYESDTLGKSSEISKILNILLTKKNKKVKEVSINNPKLCGIPTSSFEKHLEKVSSENKWTILIISQKGRPPEITRYLEKIISPGTNIDYLNSDDKRYIASVYIEKNKNILSAGLTLLDPTIGEVLIYENHGNSNDRDIVLDEIHQILNTYNVSEIIYSSEEDNLINLNIPIVNKKVGNIPIAYKEELIKNSFNVDTNYVSAIEDIDMEYHPFSLDSLVILLEFVIEHNKLIGVSIQKPKKIYSSNYMYLGNDPITQLNIYNKSSIDLLDIINKGVSAIGRRYIKEQLLNPLLDIKKIEERFVKSFNFVNSDKKDKIEPHLRDLYDIERIIRKCEIETIQPFEFYNLYISLKSILNIKKIDEIKDKKLSKFIKKIESIFNVDKMSMYNLINIKESFIIEGVSFEIDDISKKLIEIELLKELDLNSAFVLKDSDIEGLYLEITNKRYDEYHTELDDYEIENIKSLKNSKKIFLTELSELSRNRFILLDKLIKLTKDIFFKEIRLIDFSLIRKEIDYICKIEFYINNAKLYEKKSYKIPKFIKSKENFYEVEDLRHPIVEAIENELFIPNNIQFGLKKDMKTNTDVCFNSENVDGFLLYGQNSSGKTVLSKSIGISIIMAQSGFFVPCSSLTLSIFNSLFTRISGDDNLSKGLSTFAVEMLELKNILNRSTNKSMIIGDEISHGTETISGLSIVASTILSLKEKKASFIIATHLHQLDSIKDVQESKSISPIHLSLVYDEKEDKINFNRKIQKGKGSSIYGLEFAKSLKLPSEFITMAYKIRKEIANDLTGLEELTKRKKSRYNTSVFIGICSECGEKAEEVHHINEQQFADENGMIKHIHKNNKNNLKVLCKECHKKEHK